ncbi:MAG: glycosyl hydrolase family 18 protein [Acidimicrobiales bacterium]
MGRRLSAIRISLGAGARHRSRHRVTRAAAPVGVVLAVGALLCAGLAVSASGSGRPQAVRPVTTPNASIEQQFAGSAPPLALPVASAPPAPAPPALAASPPLRSHEIFAFAPWWNIAEQSSFDVKDMTTLAYFSLDVNPDGTINQADSGWNGFESQDLADLVTRAHAAGDRVVLTVTCFDQRALDELTSSSQAAARLGTELVQLIEAKNLDGVNLDFEGNGPQDRTGLDNFVATVAGQLHTADAHWQVTMSTYGSSAGDPNGFFDIAGLNRSVDGFFVMAYDMNSPSTPTPTAPLTGPGNNDEIDLSEYAQVVPRSKIILGVPYYGYDWPTQGPDMGAGATGAAKPVSYAQILSDNTPSYWDQSTATPWTAYQVNGQWHQVFFDDPTSLALKARLVNADGVAGIGVWALGMDGNSPAMLAALLGHASAAKFLTGPGSNTTANAPAVGGGSTSARSYTYSGQWNGAAETLEPVNPSTLPGNGSAHTEGGLVNFTTSDPAATCLSQAKSLPVFELDASPTTYVVQVSTPQYCTSGTWQFSAPASSSSTPTSSTTTTSPGSSGTTTPSNPSGGGSGAPGVTIPIFGTTTTTAPKSTTSSTQPGVHL